MKTLFFFFFFVNCRRRNLSFEKIAKKNLCEPHHIAFNSYHGSAHHLFEQYYRPISRGVGVCCIYCEKKLLKKNFFYTDRSSESKIRFLRRDSITELRKKSPPPSFRIVSNSPPSLKTNKQNNINRLPFGTIDQ